MTCSEAESGEGDWSGIPIGSRATYILLAPVRLLAEAVLCKP